MKTFLGSKKILLNKTFFNLAYIFLDQSKILKLIWTVMIHLDNRKYTIVCKPRYTRGFGNNTNLKNLCVNWHEGVFKMFLQN